MTLPRSNVDVTVEAHASGTGLVDSIKAQRGWLNPTLRAREQGT